MNEAVDPGQKSNAYWAIVPAAGVGARMGADRPKQYLSLGDKTVIEHTLERLLALPYLSGLIVALQPGDPYWDRLAISGDDRIAVVDGGEDRSHSVLQALNYLTLKAQAEDWVLVHDAARPCVTLEAMERLCHQAAEHPVGGILGVPVGDTLKRVDNRGAILETRDRRHLWQAQTPQLFRYQKLHQSLARSLAQGATVTDEASALELSGYQPLMVEGRTDNLKITRPEDLELARLVLGQQKATSTQ